MGVFTPALLGALAMAPLLAEVVPSEPTPVRLRYDAPSGCPDEQAFFSAVQARTALARAAHEGETARAFRVHIALDAAGSVGELRSIDEGREGAGRRVEAPSCDEVAQALALTVALSVDPLASMAPRPPPPPTASAPPPAPPPPPPPVVKHAQPVAPPSASHLELALQGIVARELQPFVNAGGALSVAIGGPSEGAWSPWLEVAVGQTRNDIFSRPSNADIALTFAALTLCPLRFGVLPRIDARLCGRGEGGIIAAHGRDVPTPHEITRTWWAAGVAGQGRWALSSRLALRLDVGLTVPLAPRQFVIDEPPRPAAESASWVPFAGVGVAFRL
jgi:hypothetical protein